MVKKIILLTGLFTLIVAAGNAQLSEAINFFNYNFCGTGQTVSWRGSCHTGDSPTGGYHDAGDHVKFGLPMAFTATMLCWADYEYGISAQTQIARGLDYFKRCINGSSITYQVGDAGADHGYWGSPENQTGSRPSYTTSQGSCVMAGTAAALAAASVSGNGGDMNLAKSAFAAAENAKSDSGYTAANGFYTSESGFYDELMWAAIWIYLGTNDKSYLTKAETYFNNLDSDYQWTHCWDDARYGAILKLAQITGKPVYKTWIEKHLDFWMKGGGITYTPGGLPYLQNWGPLRYASAAGFLAKLWSQSFYCTASKKSTYSSFATSMANYIKGSNPAGRSYIIGYGSNPPQCPHHRAGCPSKTCPCEHTLTGGLVGGPDSGDQYQDSIDQYQYSEVATDYNACLVALLACLSGGNPPTYPTPSPTPTPGPTASPGTGNGLKGEYYTGTGFGTLVMSRTDGPIDFNWAGSTPDSGLSADSFSVRWTGDLEPVYTDTYTFYESSDDGCRVSINNNVIIDKWTDGAAEESASATVSLRAGQKVPIKIEFYENGGDASVTVSWSSNYQTKEIIPKIRLYSGPVATPTPTRSATPTPSPSPLPTQTATRTATRTSTGLNGDVNSDGSITIVDALMVAQYYVGLDPANFNAARADVNCDGSITIVDALIIAQYYVGLSVTIC